MTPEEQFEAYKKLYGGKEEERASFLYGYAMGTKQTLEQGSGIVPSLLLDVEYFLLRDLIEKRALKQDNDNLRGLLGSSAKDCPYCGLPAIDQAKCSKGFPGCSRADDQMLFKHFSAAYELAQLKGE